MKKSQRSILQQRRVFLVEDHPLMRFGLREFLTQEAGVIICGEAATASGALDGISRTCPDLALVDISLEGRSGLDLLQDLRMRFPQMPVLVHSMYDEAIYADRALKAGARGYVKKQESGEELLVALRRILGGGVYLSQRIGGGSPHAGGKHGGKALGTPVASLSSREFEVFRLIGEGCDNREIARRLHISLKTVEAHREHIKRKLRVEGSTALNLFAVRWTAS